MSGVTAVARCTWGQIKSVSHMSRIFQAGIAETAALGRARGVALPEDMAAQVWQAMQDLPDDLRASTAIDLEEGRPLEVDWISGSVERLSDIAGLDAPVHRVLSAALQPWKAGQ